MKKKINQCIIQPSTEMNLVTCLVVVLLLVHRPALTTATEDHGISNVTESNTTELGSSSKDDILASTNPFFLLPSEDEAAEPLPKPEPLYGDPPRDLVVTPYPWTSSERRQSPYYYSLSPDMSSRFGPTRTKEDYFYRNRRGEWIYVVPEDDFSHVIDLGYSLDSFDDLEQHPSLTVHKDSVSSPSESNFGQINLWEPLKRTSAPPQQPMPFLTKLLNGGNGFLSILNPLTYLNRRDSSQDQGSSSRRKDRRPLSPKRQWNSRRTTRNQRRGKPFRSHLESAILKDSPRLKTTKSDIMNLDNNYKYEDYIYVDRDFQQYVDDDSIIPDFNAEFKTENNIKNAKTNEMKVTYGPTPPPSYFGTTTIKESVKETPDNLEDQVNYDNIYRFHDLDMLYDKETLKNIDKIEDDYTREYFKRNKLRDDLYVGKDGNIYLKEIAIKTQGREGVDSKSIRANIQSMGDERPLIRRVGTHVKRKQFPAYTTIKRDRKPKIHPPARPMPLVSLKPEAIIIDNEWTAIERPYQHSYRKDDQNERTVKGTEETSNPNVTNQKDKNNEPAVQKGNSRYQDMPTYKKENNYGSERKNGYVQTHQRNNGNQPSAQWSSNTGYPSYVHTHQSVNHNKPAVQWDTKNRYSNEPAHQRVNHNEPEVKREQKPGYPNEPGSFQNFQPSEVIENYHYLFSMLNRE